MKIKKYILDKIYVLSTFGVLMFILTMLFAALKIELFIIFIVILLIIVSLVICLTIDFLRKKSFYDSLINNIENLDKAYLVTATLDMPSFYEGKLTTEAIYDIGKSMNENVKELIHSQRDFKDYLEMWIHEVKIPLSSLQLMRHNHKSLNDSTVQEQLKRIDDYVEQVLYYVRQENSEKDYIIKEVRLDKLITNIALKNKDALLAKDIQLSVSGVDIAVYTDAKWLEFILGQIIDNAIKYADEKKESYIKIGTHTTTDTILLTIEDDGIGIREEDIPRIFEKSFTGQNGRLRTKSTGMGLYIVKNLIQKLGHKIEVTSELGKYTRMTIIFAKNEFYEVIK